MAEKNASSKIVAAVLLRHVKPGSVVYTDEFHSYRHIRWLGYKHFRVKHSRHVYAVGPVHLNNAESRNRHLKAFLFFKRRINLLRAGFYAAAAPAFTRLYADGTSQTCHWLLEVVTM